MNIQTMLNSIRAATAWKEHAHRLSNNSLDRLKQASLLGRYSVSKPYKSIQLKHKIPIVNKPRNSDTMYLEEQGINLNLSNFRKGTRGMSSTILPDTIHHEMMEKFTKKVDTVPNFVEQDGHKSISVLLKERKNYNQTGGNFTRGEKPNLQDIREATGEKEIIDTVLPTYKTRLKNKDYYNARKKYYKNELKIRGVL